MEMLRHRGLWFALAVMVSFASAGTGNAEDNSAKIQELQRKMAAMVDGHVERLLAEQKNNADFPEAVLVAGAFYEMGMLGDSDPVKALRMYQRSSELGLSEADYGIGKILMMGSETASGRVRRDPQKAMSYLERAAEGGSVQAMLDLARIYTDGTEEVEPDSQKALALLMDAAARGNEDALGRLEPVMRQAREWEEAKPGRKANFPTSEAEIINTSLVEESKAKTKRFDKLASRMYQELNKRIAKSVGRDSGSLLKKM